jgi:diacylglycerol kinase
VGRYLRAERSSFGYAFQGIGHAWRTQRHLRVHASVAVVCIGLGLALSLRAAEWAALITMITLVATMEMLNTVIEVVVDMISPNYHPGAKVAKDVAAGTVLIAALGAALVGAFIFLPRLLALLR